MMIMLNNSWVRNGDYSVGGFWEGWPAEGPITQVFAQQSVTGSTHTGVDIAAPYRSPMIAPHSGMARHYRYGDFGNHVIISLPADDQYGELYMVMAHMDDFEDPRDRWVEAGTLLGRVGYSGKVVPSNVGGTHVHFGFGKDMMISGDYRRCVDPYIFIQRAELEDEMATGSRMGLQFLACGDFTKLYMAYEKLRAHQTQFLQTIYPEGQAENFYSIPSEDALRQLNCADVMRFQILGLAATDVADQAYQVATS